MTAKQIDWDKVSDEDLCETMLERIGGLKEMFPEKLRVGASSTLEWGWWMGKGSFCAAKSFVWIVSVTSMIMLIPYYFQKEILDVEMEQVKQQRQMLLGSSSPAP